MNRPVTSVTPPDFSTGVYNWLEKFAGYGFIKSSAYAYAMVAYQTSYLKADYPDEFLSALTQTAVDAELREDTTPGRLSS